MFSAFGRRPTGDRKKRIEQSPNYKNGKFVNKNYTPDLNPKYSYWQLLGEYFKKHIDKNPVAALPADKVNLNGISPEDTCLIWFGHSSYLIHFAGKRILVDPVFSGAAAPFSFLLRAYNGADAYSTEDLPEIDLLILSHDHYDHTDYDTLKKIKPKVKKVLTSLGVGSHLEYWGYNGDKITELDWDESTETDGLLITCTTARHFSGRGLYPKSTLWSAFVLESNHQRIYIGGDSGYDTHFKEIGSRFKSFDLVILDSGQYHDQWKDIHMVPEETVQAAVDLNAKKLFAVHWSKFTMAHHPWYEPVERMAKAAEAIDLPYFTAKIGEVVEWNKKIKGDPWWKMI